MSAPGPATHELTDLLHAHRAGDRGAFDRLLGRVYDELRRIARGQLRAGGTLSPTELVHESWFKLADEDRAAWENRGHFFAVAASAMRQVLIDRARRRAALKRGAGERAETLDEERLAPSASSDEALFALDQALGELATIEPRLARVVECRFFAGYSARETAEALGVTERTAGRDWVKARTLLRAMLGDDAEPLAGTGPTGPGDGRLSNESAR